MATNFARNFVDIYTVKRDELRHFFVFLEVTVLRLVYYFYIFIFNSYIERYRALYTSPIQ